MKEMLKNAAILLGITVVAGFLLGLVYANTKDIIAQREYDEKVESYNEVFADADSFEEVMDFMTEDVRNDLDGAGFESEDIDELNIAKDASGNTLGYVMTLTTHEGYGGDIQFTLGVCLDGTVNSISILDTSESPGLGLEADKVLKPQFENKCVESFTYTKTGSTSDSEIDAISGATITTNAVVNGVDCGLYYFNNYLKGGADNE